jgi:hypothetical protein
MQVFQLGKAAPTNSSHSFALKTGVGTELSTFTQPRMNPGEAASDRTHSNVERQFMQMNDVHNRIRVEFLGNQGKPVAESDRARRGRQASE